MELRRQARHDLVALVVAVIAVGRLADDTAAWFVAVLVAVATALGALAAFRVMGDARPARWPWPSLVTPAIVAGGCVAAIRLVPFGVGLLVALLGAAALLWLALDLEGRLLARPSGPTVQDRTAILAVGLLAGFLAFVGIAALVPGGLVEPGAGDGSVEPLAQSSLLLLAGADAVVALLLGYRFAALRIGHLRPAARAALGYAAAIAIAAGLLRAAALPRLLGPAMLTLVLFLWDSVRGASPGVRRDPRFLWQVALLAIMGVVVVAWNLQLR